MSKIKWTRCTEALLANSVTILSDLNALRTSNVKTLLNAGVSVPTQKKIISATEYSPPPLFPQHKTALPDVENQVT